MSDYLYNAIIYKTTDNVVGLDVTQNNLDKTDFETNYKSSCEDITLVNVAATTFEHDETYTDFKAMITGDITWSDVKMVEGDNKYTLYLLISQ